MIGFLCLYKEKGITSFGAVARLRRIIGEKKLGHCGTLDPMATGVLPVAVGRASKFIELLPDNNKAYTAEFTLGIRTDTLDITGNILSETKVNIPTEAVLSVIQSFVGEQLQTPPMYSALSKNGVRLYELARQGIETEREARKINIYSICDICETGINTYKMNVRCSKGTYIRSLVDDIGSKLGCGAVLTQLERTESNGFTLANAVTLDGVQRAVENSELEKLLISVDELLEEYPAIRISEAQHKRFKNGVCLDLSRLPDIKEGQIHRVYAPNGDFVAIGEKDLSQGVLNMKKLYEL